MNKIISRCILIVALGAWLVTAVNSPHFLSDANSFLSDFVGSNLLAFLGIIVSVTLASTVNINLELNRMESKYGSNFASGTRFRVKVSALSLILLLVLAFMTVFLKSLAHDNVYIQAMLNGFALIIVLTNILILTDITQLVFNIKGVEKNQR